MVCLLVCACVEHIKSAQNVVSVHCLWLSFISSLVKTKYKIIPSYITKSYPYNFDPLKPHLLYCKIVKLGFTGVYIILLINIDCEYSLETPCRGGSNEYQQSLFEKKYEKLVFLSENFLFLVVKFSIYLNRCFCSGILLTSISGRYEQYRADPGSIYMYM